MDWVGTGSKAWWSYTGGNDLLWGLLPVLQLYWSLDQRNTAGLGLGQVDIPRLEARAGLSSVSHMPPCPTGLTEPMLIRLDVESKLSEQLKVSFVPLPPAPGAPMPTSYPMLSGDS